MLAKRWEEHRRRRCATRRQCVAMCTDRAWGAPRARLRTRCRWVIDWLIDWLIDWRIDWLSRRCTHTGRQWPDICHSAVIRQCRSPRIHRRLLRTFVSMGLRAACFTIWYVLRSGIHRHRHSTRHSTVVRIGRPNVDGRMLGRGELVYRFEFGAEIDIFMLIWLISRDTTRDEGDWGTVGVDYWERLIILLYI